MYFVYILECRDRTLYTGITTSVARRLAEHKAGTASKYTRVHKAVRMVFTQQCRTRSSASKREAAIKRLTRTQKLVLIRRG